jgi:hypothetical protein
MENLFMNESLNLVDQRADTIAKPPHNFNLIREKQVSQTYLSKATVSDAFNQSSVSGFRQQSRQIQTQYLEFNIHGFDSNA